jgi:tetratricopeptide (TPR) repeat protein
MRCDTPGQHLSLVVRGNRPVIDWHRQDLHRLPDNLAAVEGKAVPDSAHKTYSTEEIVSLSKLPSDMIQELAQFGLLDERGGRFGFRDLASARQFAKLLADGVSLPEIIRGVNQIRKWLPEASLANVRLHPGPQRSLEIEQAGGRTDKNGQFVLAIDGSQHSSDELFGQAQLAEETKNIAEAERLYRILMKSDPTDASAPFNLGNLLRAGARNVEAEAALRAATRADPTFAEAWYNLSDLLDEQGRSEAAIECLRTALEVAPNYADAIFQSRAAIAKKK